MGRILQSLAQEHLLKRYIQQYMLKDHLNDNLLACLQVYQFKPEQAVYTALSDQTHLYFLVEGKAQVSYYLANGKQSIIMIITPFSVVGDMEFLGDHPVQMNVIATEISTFLGIRKSDALKYGYDDARFLRFIIQYMSHKLRISGQYQLSYDVPLINRVALYLLSQPINNTCITVENKTIIADFLGTTTRHLNRVIKILENDSLIQWDRGKVVILDLPKLQCYGEL